VADCVIYSSTHWLGPGHPFNKCINKETTERIELMWYDNPVDEAVGLYTTEKPGEVTLIDVDYYRKNHPELMAYI